MGWKNVKEHYGIKHIVQVTDAGICIGSGYVHNILTIRADLSIERSSIGRGEPFDSMVAAMEADRPKLRELIDSPDTFSASIPVYTFTYDGAIVEALCEQPGWPNVTHDGRIMYDNTHFPERSQAVAQATKELDAVAENAANRCAEARLEVEKAEIRRAEAEAAVEHLKRAIRTGQEAAP